MSNTNTSNQAVHRLVRAYYKLNEANVEDEMYESNDSDISGYLSTLDELEADGETFSPEETAHLSGRVKILKRYYALKEQLKEEFRQIYG